MTDKNVLIKDKAGNTLYPKTQASLVINGVQYEDLNEEIEANPTTLIEQWEAYQKEVNAVIEAYQQQVISLREELNQVKSVRYVVETYQNGTEWYVIYSDGWCEQGGIVKKGSTLASGGSWSSTVSLFVPYKDVDYSINLIFGFGTATGSAGSEQRYQSKTQSTFDACVYNRNSSTTMPAGLEFNWITKGYIL